MANDSGIIVAPPPALDPRAAARLAKLRHVGDDMPGITRTRARHGFDYRRPDGSLVDDFETLSRIKRLAIPPAWTAVWICPNANGHIQATGRDARGRKQYRYHPRWRQVRDASKYGKLLIFAGALPSIRARIDADLRRRGLPRERVLAAVVRLMETTFFRVGNTEYAKANGSFGLTTLRGRHVAVEGSRVHLSFRGKSGRRHESDLHDRRLARIIHACRELPGYELFQYLDEAGERHTIDSGDVNDYLRDITDQDITAKDFRTWAGTMLAARTLQQLPVRPTESQKKHTIVRAVEEVAKHLGNTPAICRRCYIHPAIFEGYLDGSLLPALQQYRGRAEMGLHADEAAVVAFLQSRLESALPSGLGARRPEAYNRSSKSE